MKDHLKRLGALLLACLLAPAGLAQDPQSAPPAARSAAEAPTASPPARRAKVVVIPIREQIAQPVLYVLRRGLKEAIEQKADTVVLDMETPGGRLDVTFEILEALNRFPGRTLTYVNREAISAGAFISAGTDEIYFHPEGVIGAAAPVNATGEAIDKTMNAKIISYLKAKVRAMTEGKGYRAQVITAMADLNYELKIGDEILKQKDELLSLTASEAMKTYGDPPIHLLGAGISASIGDLLTTLHGKDGYEVIRVELTWSERLAQYITNLAPLLMSIGILLLFIEFKTPGFGVFGISGGVLLAIVFFGHYAAGLSGHEPAIFFLIGLILLVVELFFFPGTAIMAVSGLVLMLGSLVWSMADLWPNEPVTLSGDVFLRPLLNVLLGVVIAVGGFLLLLRFLPSGGPWSRMVLNTAVGGEPVAGRPLVASGTRAVSELVGREALAVTPLFPSGQVELDGRRYEARMAMGFAEAGARVTVTATSEFGLIVETRLS